MHKPCTERRAADVLAFEVRGGRREDIKFDEDRQRNWPRFTVDSVAPNVCGSNCEAIRQASKVYTAVQNVATHTWLEL